MLSLQRIRERNNRGTVGFGVLCWPRPEALWDRLADNSEASASLRLGVVASGGQRRLGVSGQELRPRGAMRQWPTGKDLNTET
jgi:hypothetical protein